MAAMASAPKPVAAIRAARCILSPPPLFSSGERRQQGIERALASSRLLEPGVAQAAMPVEVDLADRLAGLDEQVDRLTAVLRRRDRGAQSVGVEGAAVDADDLRTDGEAGVEGGAVPDHAVHLAVPSRDGE